MDQNMLATVIRLRQLAVDAAGNVLADALRRQGDAERELARAERAMHEATVRATDPDGDDDAVEAFATWLPEGRRRVEGAHAALDRCAAQAVQARIVLGLARTALIALQALAGVHGEEPPGAAPHCRQAA